MEKGLLDIGLLLEPVDMEKYEFIRLNIREKWVVLMKSDDPLSKKETVSAKDLSVLPLILPRRMNVQSELASWFGNYYEKLDIVFYQQFKYEQRNYGEWRLGIFIGD